MKDKNLNIIKAYLACVVGHTFWGFSFFASRKGLDTADVMVLLSHRFLIAFLLMSIPAIKLCRYREKGRKLIWLLLFGLAEPIVYFFGEQYGILHSNTIFSGLMIATIPIVCTLLAIPVLGEKVSVGQFLFSLVSVGGVVGVGLLQKDSGSLDWIGVAALMVAVLSASAHTLLNRRMSVEFTAFERTYSMMVIGAVFFSVLAIIKCGGSVSVYLEPLQDKTYVLAILFLGVCCSVGSYFLTSYAIGRLSVARQTVFANLTTAVSIFAGAVFLHEPFSWVSLMFCILILGGIYGVQMMSVRAEKKNQN